jgi:hypothetical protein
MHLGLGLLFAQCLHDGFNALGNLLGAVTAHVIGTDHNHSNLGFDAVQFAVLDAPEDVLRAVAADAEVRGLERGKILVPGRLGIAAAPGLSDRVAQEDDGDIALHGLGDEALVPFQPAWVRFATLAEARCRHLGRIHSTFGRKR